MSSSALVAATSDAVGGRSSAAEAEPGSAGGRAARSNAAKTRAAASAASAASRAELASAPSRGRPASGVHARARIGTRAPTFASLPSPTTPPRASARAARQAACVCRQTRSVSKWTPTRSGAREDMQRETNHFHVTRERTIESMRQRAPASVLRGGRGERGGAGR